jgi:hypothetical protein
MTEAGADYVRRIRAMDIVALRRLWAEIQANDTPGWESGKALEHLILRAFEVEGAHVKYPFKVASPLRLLEQDGKYRAPKSFEQLDGAVFADGLSCLVECKDGADVEDMEPIAKLRLRLERRPVTVMGLVFSRSGFSVAAKIVAQFLSPLNIILWDGNDIDLCLHHGSFRQGLVNKHRVAVAEGRPTLSLIEEFLGEEAEP